MLKKITLGVLALIVVVPALLVGYLFSIKEERVTENVEPNSIIHNQKYQTYVLEAEQWLESVYLNNTFPSFSVSVGIQGELIWEGVIGYSDVKAQKLADYNTKYRIGSISKAMTATAVMRMQEKNMLAIEDSFKRYVDDYPPKNSMFTLQQLLTHQGGVRHYTKNLSENFSRTEYSTTREAASIVENDALLFTPGEDFHYSTYGYTLLSLAMESAYSAPFEEIMYDEVFIPAGMVDTEFHKGESASSRNRATAYIDAGGALYRSPKVNVSYKYAGGGFLSTPSDMVRFGNALLGDTLLTEDSKELMWSPVALENGEMNPQNYALGFRVWEDDGKRFVHHGGNSVGGLSFLLIHPELDIVVAFATNVTPTDGSFDRLQAATKVIEIFVEEI